MPSPHAPSGDGADADRYIHRLLQLAEQSLAALDADDAETALLAIEQRGPVLQGLAGPLERLGQLTRRAHELDGSERTRLEERVTALQGLLVGLRASEASLVERLTRLRDGAANQLQRLRGPETRGAYAAIPPGGHLDRAG
jgi:hypothetical protein